jgi:deoxyribodipyrimidine photolyase
MIQVVWFKRDLRFEDHAPLAEPRTSPANTRALRASA